MKKYILPMLGLALMTACSDDASSNAVNVVDNPDQPGISSSSVAGNPDNPPLSSEGGDTPQPNPNPNPTPDPSATTYFATFPTANQLAVQEMYNNWIAKFYVTYEEVVPASEEPYLG